MATQTETLSSQNLDIALESLDFPDLPPFPTDIKAAPLHRLSLSSLRRDISESDRLFSASRELGFFYLDLRGDAEGEALLNHADRFFSLAPKLYDLGREELRKYDYKSLGSYVGYKGYGSAVVDEEGNLDRNEFYNISKDDFLGINKDALAHPEILHQHKDLITSYIRTSHSLVTFILSHLNSHLQLPPHTLEDLHRLNEPSGDQIRLIKSPPQPPSDSRTALGKHTDFGSLTLLFNRLGGLQILPPPSLTPPGQEPEWTYVRPLRGHCIVNIGDAMTKMSGDVLRSNIHRVVAPPGLQAGETRWSVVYFSRPGDEVPLKRLDSEVIPKAETEEEAMSSKEWIKLKAMAARDVDSNTTKEQRQKLWESTGRGN